MAAEGSVEGGSVQPSAAKKCKHCGLTCHLRRTSARCPHRNSKMQAPPHLELLVHETTGNTDFTDTSNTSCGSSVAGMILQDRDTPVKLSR